jgi:hypothetical protein
MRWVVVLASLTAWFSLSNHCALASAAVGENPEAETSNCPMHSTPAKKKPVSKTPCCKEVRAVVAKCVVANTVLLRLARSVDYAAEILLSPSRDVGDLESLDTGPPGSFSFAELVLQQSMPAHAPPVS